MPEVSNSIYGLLIMFFVQGTALTLASEFYLRVGSKLNRNKLFQYSILIAAGFYALFISTLYFVRTKLMGFEFNMEWQMYLYFVTGAITLTFLAHTFSNPKDKNTKRFTEIPISVRFTMNMIVGLGGFMVGGIAFIFIALFGVIYLFTKSDEESIEVFKDAFIQVLKKGTLVSENGLVKIKTLAKLGVTVSFSENLYDNGGKIEYMEVEGKRIKIDRKTHTVKYDNNEKVPLSFLKTLKTNLQGV